MLSAWQQYALEAAGMSDKQIRRIWLRELIDTLLFAAAIAGICLGLAYLPN